MTELNLTTSATKMTASQASDLITQSINDFLTQSGNNANQVQAQLQTFLAQIQPDIETALAEGDLESLKYIRDRTAMALARVSMNLLYKEQQTVTAIVMTVLTVGIKFAVAAA